MTDKEMVIHLMKKINREIVYEEENYIEVDFPGGEDISFEFNEDGNLIDFY